MCSEVGGCDPMPAGRTSTPFALLATFLAAGSRRRRREAYQLMSHSRHNVNEFTLAQEALNFPSTDVRENVAARPHGRHCFSELSDIDGPFNAHGHTLPRHDYSWRCHRYQNNGIAPSAWPRGECAESVQETRSSA